MSAARDHELQVLPAPAERLGGEVRLLIADCATTRIGIRLALGSGVPVCAEVGSAEHAIRVAKHEQPDVALIGTALEGDWRAAVRGVCRAAPRCAVVVLSQSNEVDEMLAAVRAGAVGYVPGSLEAERLQRVFQALAEEEAVVPRSMVKELLSELRDGHLSGSPLTAREAQILGMVRRGHSTARIADCLQIAPVTVRRHVSELVRKLGVENRSELVAATSEGRTDAGDQPARWRTA
jgi:DNA-binding NarL/FixJ family response regulator